MLFTGGSFMLQGRFQIRYYLLIAYLGAMVGFLFSNNLDSYSRIVIAVGLLIFGMFGHLTKVIIGFFVSITLNSIGMGVLLMIYADYAEVTLSNISVLIGTLIMLVLYEAVAALASAKLGKNIGFLLSIIIILGSYFTFVSIALDSNSDILTSMMYMQHIGILFMIAMWVTGKNTEKLLRNCSIASFALLAIAIVIGILILASSADGDVDLDMDLDLDIIGNNSDFKFLSNRSAYRHHYYYDDALWFHTYSRRTEFDTYLEKNEEQNKEKNDAEKKINSGEYEMW